jgi:hypothetical protein
MLNTYTHMVCDCKCVAISDCIAEPEAFESLLVFFLFCIAFSKPDVESDVFGHSWYVFSFALPSQIHQLVYQIHGLPSP